MAGADSRGATCERSSRLSRMRMQLGSMYIKNVVRFEFVSSNEFRGFGVALHCASDSHPPKHPLDW